MSKRALSSSSVKPTTYCPFRRAGSFGCAPARAASNGVLGKSDGTLASSAWAMRVLYAPGLAPAKGKVKLTGLRSRDYLLGESSGSRRCCALTAVSLELQSGVCRSTFTGVKTFAASTCIGRRFGY